MNGLDNLPARGPQQDIEARAVAAFRNAISSVGLFQTQVDQLDSGTDFQLEALDASGPTNFRVHAQVKGSTAESNKDGTVSVPVERTNLNYLLSQPSSIYVCLHLPTDRLMAAYAADVYYGYEARGQDLATQRSITVRFRTLFDPDFQERLRARVIADGRSGRDDRLAWGITPPEKLPGKVRDTIPLIEVPSDPTKAYMALRELIGAGEDAAISRAFDRFAAVLKEAKPAALLPAYLAEINLGVTRQPFDADRVREGLQILDEAKALMQPASYHYCLGNGFLALGMFDEAKEAYLQAQVCADESGESAVSAQASKNLGSVMEELGHRDAARACYERALELDPLLAEAHWALGLWHGRFGNSPEQALDHLDQVVEAFGSHSRVAARSGWRAHFLFETGRERDAFTELNHLLSLSAGHDWAWPWAARLVATHGRTSTSAAARARRFWDRYLANDPEHFGARVERVLCLWKLRSDGKALDVSLDDYRNLVMELIERSENPSQKAFLWDRLGHWAQWEKDWSAATEAYRRAFEIEPDRYGYCLGTALNFLERYDEALPILQRQAGEHLPDAMSWFQVGIAQDGLGDPLLASEAFQRAIDMDENYDLAWFNLGGMLWSADRMADTILVWCEAARRFPDHHLVEELPGVVQDALAEPNGS